MLIIPLARFCFTFIFECSPVFKGWIFQLAMLNYQRIDRCFVALIAEVCQCHDDLPFQVPPLPFANAGPAKKARKPVGCLGSVLYYSRSMKKWAHSKKGYPGTPIYGSFHRTKTWMITGGTLMTLNTSIYYVFFSELVATNYHNYHL